VAGKLDWTKNSAIRKIKTREGKRWLRKEGEQSQRAAFYEQPLKLKDGGVKGGGVP